MLFTFRRSQKRALMTVALCATAVALVPATAQASGSSNTGLPKVMTRNLYLGADLNPALGAILGCLQGAIPPADCPGAIASANQTVWNQVQATNFPARAKLLAKEIDDDDPYVVGLQEVAMWRSGPTNTQGVPDATHVDYDFLKTLLAELKARGLKYAAAVVQQEADIEGPALDGKDHRLTMRDVILTRTDLPSLLLSFGNPLKGNYSTILSVPNPLAPNPFATPINFTRGWTSLDVSILRKPVARIVNTHLESAASGVRQAQAAELIGASGPLTNPNQVAILVGDFNSDSAIAPCQIPDPQNPPPCASSGVSDGAAIGIITNFGGFVDSGNTENTFGHPSNLLDFPSVSFTERIDHILTRPGSPFTLSNKVVGDGSAPVYRTSNGPTGLWPSDHGGLIVGLG